MELMFYPLSCGCPGQYYVSMLGLVLVKCCGERSLTISTFVT